MLVSLITLRPTLFMKKLFLAYFLLFLSLCFAQKETSNWYFGNGASVSFIPPKAIVTNNSEMYTNEGVASISDEKGILLFYTDGVTVWNKNHQEMPNGKILNGSNSSTQSAIILKKINTKYEYYIFTTDEFAGSKGFSYSIVDMRLNSGLGDVILKNQYILGPVSEKLTAVKHDNGKAWWVIVHQWNSANFYSYLLDETGLGKPVISTIGAIHKDIGSGKNSEAIGYLKASPDGTRLASVISYTPNNTIELFDFDNATGRIANIENLPSPGFAYGLAFSPDNSKLYVSYQAGNHGIVQYDLNEKNIAASAVRISKIDSSRYGALQLAPDGKIYCAKLETYLDAIINPDAKGHAAGFAHNYLSLNGMYSTFGLPDFFLLNYTPLTVKLGNDTTICEKSYTLDTKVNGARYIWSNGFTDSKITIGKSGTYWVQVIKNGTIASDTIKVKFRKSFKLDLGNDTLICSDFYPLDAGNPGSNASYRWSTGATTQSLVATKSGTYIVNVSDGICVKTDSVNVKFAGAGKPFIPMKEFRPNNGGFNDRFDYILNDVTWFTLKVKNKKGKIVFETSDRKRKWNGTFESKEVKAGTYYWEIEYKTVCFKNKVIKEKGEILVL